MRRRRLFPGLALALAAVLAAVLAAGCSDEEGRDDPGAAPAGEDAGGEGDTDASSGPHPEPVDVCALFTDDDFEHVFGVAPEEPGQATEPVGSMLGMCTHFSMSGPNSGISARPVGEWDDTIAAYDFAAVDGVDYEAHWADEVGLMVRFDGQPYMLQVLAGTQIGTFDRDKSIAVADAIAADL